MVQNPKYKPAVEIVHQLCDVVAKNGNLLLNVGPYADGSFHPEAKQILMEVGNWLNVCGEAIYATRPYKIAVEGPTDVDDSNYDVNRINKQLENDGIASDIKLKTFTARDFRFTQKGDAIFAIDWDGLRTGYLESAHLSVLMKTLMSNILNCLVRMHLLCSAKQTVTWRLNCPKSLPVTMPTL